MKGNVHHYVSVHYLKVLSAAHSLICLITNQSFQLFKDAFVFRVSITQRIQLFFLFDVLRTIDAAFAHEALVTITIRTFQPLTGGHYQQPG